MDALRNLSKGLADYNIWVCLAHNDLSRRFRGSFLGVFWLVLQHLFFAFGVGILWSKLFNIDATVFIPFLSAGIAVWGFITASFTQGCMTFVSAHGLLKQLPLEKSIFIIRTVYVNFVPASIGLVTATVLLMFFRDDAFGWGFVAVIPGLVLLIASGLAVTYALSYLGVRYRDIQHGLPSVFQALFFLTPIVYPVEIMKERGLDLVLYINPFTALIEIVRTPLLDSTWADQTYYLMTLGFILFFTVLGFVLYRNFDRKVVYWI